MKDTDKTREQLIEEIKLLRILIDSLPDRLYVKDKDSRFVIYNKAVAQDSELPPPADFTGKSDFDTFTPEKAKVFYDEEQRIIKTGQSVVNRQVHRLLRGGQDSWSLVTKVPWRDNSGNIIGIIGSNREITELKKAQLALQESENRYKAIFETTREGILAADIETKQFKYANPAACRMFGYTAEEMRQLSVCDIHPKEFLPLVFLEFDALVSGKKELSRNIPCLNRNGTIFYADINSTCVAIDNRPCIAGFFADVTKHRQAEEALRESEQRYRLLVEQLPAITYTAALDEVSTTLYVSPQVLQILGVSPADYRADPDLWRKMLHPDDRDRVLAELAASHRSGQFFKSEYRMVAKDGRVVWIRDNARIVKDDDGKPLYLQGVMYDITASKQAEYDLRQSEEKFRGIAERSFDMVFMTDAAGVITYLSPASERIFGYRPEEMVGRHFSNFLMESDIPKATYRYNEKLKGHDHGVLYLEAKKKNNASVFIELNSSSIIQNGVICGTQGIIRDVTERKRAETELQKVHDELENRVKQRTADLARAIDNLQKEIAERKHAELSLRQAEERFRTVFENTIVGLYRTTPDGRILLVNPALVKMLGYDSFEEMAKVNLEKEGFDPSYPRSVFKQRIEKEGRVIGLESVWLKKDGSHLFVSESAFAVKDDKGNILYYEGTAQDITKRKEAESKLLGYQQQLRSLASELSLAEERLRRKIAIDLHDNISQNLAISKMKLESAASDLKNPNLAKSLAEVATLIGQTIEATRSLTFEMSPPVLYELGFEAAIGWLASQTRQRFGIVAEFIDDGKRKLLDDDVRIVLFQAVRELITNVVKHSKAAKMKISTKAVKGRIRIIVEDNGVGFEASRTAAGFGLFNIRERLDHIGGSVDIRSKPGLGAKVILAAPLLKINKNRKSRPFKKQEHKK